MTSVSQTEFHDAVFDPDAQRPAGLHDGKGAPAGKRFDVYRNNVVVSLKDAMRTGFPVIEKLIGPENFSNLVGLYVRQRPPSDPRLVHYGAAFPTFLAEFAPLQHLGYLPDVAQLELAMRASYNAADDAILAGEAFAEVAPELLADAQVDLRDSTQVLASRWPIMDIWRFNTVDAAPQPRNIAQSVLITRPEFDPEPHELPPGGYTLLTQLASGATLGTALEQTHEKVAEFDFGAVLAQLLDTRALHALHVPTA